MKKSTAILAILGLVLSMSVVAGSAFAASKKSHFDDCDKNGAGFLTQQEFAGCFPRLADKFSAIDANHDGHVTKEEMKAYHDAKKGSAKKSKKHTEAQ